MFYHPKSMGFSIGTFFLVPILGVISLFSGIGNILFLLVGIWGFGVMFFDRKHKEEFIKYQIQYYKNLGKDEKYARATVDTQVQMLPVLYVLFSISTVAGLISLINTLF